jgi:hypothetical protein
VDIGAALLTASASHPFQPLAKCQLSTHCRHYALGYQCPMDWLAIVVLPAIWATAVYATPYVKTHRHSLSFALSLLAGLLAFASLRVGSEQLFVALFALACLTATAMFVAMLCKETRRNVS